MKINKWQLLALFAIIFAVQLLSVAKLGYNMSLHVVMASFAAIVLLSMFAKVKK